MKSLTKIFRPKFVDHAPTPLQAGVLYISIPYSMVLHLCPCGCGKEVATKLSPVRYSMTYDGDTVSLSPSIGNFQFDCRSHYFIERNKVLWANDWSDDRIKSAKKADAKEVEAYYKKPTKKGKRISKGSK